MGYRTLNLEPSASRLTMTIGVDRKAVSFNKAICAKMGIRHIVPGRYRIVGRDGAFWLTGIKYNEE